MVKRSNFRTAFSTHLSSSQFRSCHVARCPCYPDLRCPHRPHVNCSIHRNLRRFPSQVHQSRFVRFRYDYGMKAGEEVSMEQCVPLLVEFKNRLSSSLILPIWLRNSTFVPNPTLSLRMSILGSVFFG